MSRPKCKISYVESLEPQDIGVEPSADGSGTELEVEALAAGGRGVARSEGLVWLVPGGLPGDRLLAEVGRRHRRWVEGRPVRLIRASQERRRAPCRLHGRCGGCPWMALDDAAQREWKRRLVAEALERIGGQLDCRVEPTVAGEGTLGYRNKVEFNVGCDAAGRPTIGLHSGGRASRPVDVDRCPLQDDSANRVLASTRRFFERAGERFRSALRDGAPYRLVIRRSAWSGDLLVALGEFRGPFPSAERLARELMRSHPELRGVVRLWFRAGRREGARTIPVAGRTWIEERIGETVFRLPAGCFTQVNSEIAAKLVERVVQQAGPLAGQRVLDLYAGVGILGLALARAGARVTCCEADAAAVACGRGAARHAGLSSASFVRSDVGAYLQAGRGSPADLVVANPPRAGLGRGVVEAIGALGPRRIVLISCDPPTLARDVRRFCRHGYRLRRAVPLDMFPQTAHVEAVAFLDRPGRGPDADPSERGA